MSNIIIGIVGLIILFFSTGYALTTIPEIKAQSDCDSSYPDSCIPSPPPNLNCKDISDKKFEVLPPDPHGLDRDGDGIGCES